MLSLRGLAMLACSSLALVACSGDGTGPSVPPSSVCTDANIQILPVGAFTIIDPAKHGSCVRVPAAGGAGAQYLYAALATEGTETASGNEAPYELNGGAGLGSAAVAALPNPLLAPFRAPAPTTAAAFHHRLREQERALAQAPSAIFRQGAPQAITAAITRPAVGDHRTFFVCGTSECKSSEFVQAAATVKYVGQRVAIYVDDAAPPNGYNQSQLDDVGGLFDQYLYPIDTTAFGYESDIDNNGVVIVLLTQRVNALTPNCSTSQSVILGYFFGLDLEPIDPHSNHGEVFYSLVPDPTNVSCTITTDFATQNLPPTFIHEFQHMISYGQHVLARHSSTEDVWLNEGLSHFAEELGGRQIPDARCFQNDCLSQFASGDLDNAYNYLRDPEANYLVAPGNSTGTLEERGAGWLFVRWLADQFGADALGGNVTRQLVNTKLVGAANVEAVTNQSFSKLVPLWQMANYLDNLPNFTPSTSFVQYRSWDFRAVFNAFHAADPGHFPAAYPLEPDQVTTTASTLSGVLRAGSGRHLLVTQSGSDGQIDVQLTASDGSSLPPATIEPRIALLRIR